jgi:hypothetical protein
MTRVTVICALAVVAGACSNDPSSAGNDPRIVARLVLDPSPAKAVHLEVSGPGTDEFVPERQGMLAEQWKGNTALALALFGEDLAGALGSFPNVDLDAPRLELVRVVEAVGEDNFPLPAGTVTARVVIDTIR